MIIEKQKILDYYEENLEKIEEILNDFIEQIENKKIKIKIDLKKENDKEEYSLTINIIENDKEILSTTIWNTDEEYDFVILKRIKELNFNLLVITNYIIELWKTILLKINEDIYTVDEWLNNENANDISVEFDNIDKDIMFISNFRDKILKLKKEILKEEKDYLIDLYKEKTEIFANNWIFIPVDILLKNWLYKVNFVI